MSLSSLLTAALGCRYANLAAHRAMFNESIWNELVWNETSAAPFVPVIVDTTDPGVSFTISDELGGISEVGSSDGCEC